MRIDEMLSSRHVHFESLQHRPTFTANRMAQVLHIPGKEVAKSVLLRSGGDYVLVVLPATHYVDMERIRRRLGEENVEMASEDEIAHMFPDCEPGAMPPFGSLYDVPTLMDSSLAEDEEIVFENQSHAEAIRMRFEDYDTLEHPIKGRFSY
ncbi:Proline--tRNA ligase [Symmachiella macrocystis]|uniref:Proline--tRNA ligase n=1 Tax=Symmachiella macrocystis TaxID=2527985 RepID=A0A5C6BK60_9PLAN|nr:YbaK/EbsC family protein [Symmachiella macrocystis]TWU12375.1 Proline--tRNA ligase [Symmachiella macrocystis]